MQILFLIAACAFGAILVIWIGYPVIIWLLSLVVRRRNYPHHEQAGQRKVSVILATRDHAPVIADRVRNLLNTAHRADLLEVIVGLDADGALAKPDELSDLDPRVRIVIGDLPGGKASTLNAAVRAASNEMLVMADTSQRFDANTIPELAAAMQDPEFGAVSGALALGSDRGRQSPVHWYWTMEKWLRFNESLVHSSIGVTGAVYATRKTTWPVIPAGVILDDVYVPMSLVMQGFRTGFTHKARATDVRTFSANAEGARKARTLTGVLQLREHIPGLLSRKNPVLIQFVMHKLSRLATPYLLLLGMGACVGMVAIALFAHPRLFIVVAVIVATLVAIPAIRHRLWSGMTWIGSLQRASMAAVSNARQGRWSVWHK